MNDLIINQKENNELLADYLGFTKSSDEIQKFTLGTSGDYYEKESGEHSYLNFHRDWNDLMKVVNKLEKEKHPVFINSNNCSIYWSTNSIKKNEFIVDYTLDTKIQSTYESVIKFVKYINTQKNKK